MGREEEDASGRGRRRTQALWLRAHARPLPDHDVLPGADDARRGHHRLHAPGAQGRCGIDDDAWWLNHYVMFPRATQMADMLLARLLRRPRRLVAARLWSWSSSPSRRTRPWTDRSTPSSARTGSACPCCSGCSSTAVLGLRVRARLRRPGREVSSPFMGLSPSALPTCGRRILVGSCFWPSGQCAPGAHAVPC